MNDQTLSSAPELATPCTYDQGLKTNEFKPSGMVSLLRFIGACFMIAGCIGWIVLATRPDWSAHKLYAWLCLLGGFLAGMSWIATGQVIVLLERQITTRLMLSSGAEWHMKEQA